MIQIVLVESNIFSGNLLLVEAWICSWIYQRRSIFDLSREMYLCGILDLWYNARDRRQLEEPREKEGRCWWTFLDCSSSFWRCKEDWSLSRWWAAREIIVLPNQRLQRPPRIQSSKIHCTALTTAPHCSSLHHKIIMSIGPPEPSKLKRLSKVCAATFETKYEVFWAALVATAMSRSTLSQISGNLQNLQYWFLNLQ